MAEEPSTTGKPLLDKENHIIHVLYTTQEFDECVKLIDDILAETNGVAEYPVYVKALTRRMQGRISESLELFQEVTTMNPYNDGYMKQVAHSLYLLGRYSSAMKAYDEAQKLGYEQWEIHHNKGQCYLQLSQYENAVQCFQRANQLQAHERTYMSLGKAYTLMEQYNEAIEVYRESLEMSPDNAEVLTSIGLLYLRLGETYRAFDYLGNALTHDPRDTSAILAAGSVIQDHSDMDVALVKYRVAAKRNPNSAQLWNNVGMCFFGKQKYTAAIACLKKGLSLDPLAWIIEYNLGLVHLHTKQYASAFHFFSAAINLKPDFASTYMHLAIALANLDDFENSSRAYEKAIEMEQDPLFLLNYAITLWNNGEVERAADAYEESSRMLAEWDEETRNAHKDMLAAKEKLQKALTDNHSVNSSEGSP